MLRRSEMSLTTEQVLALAPDASSAKSGRDLAVPRKWATLGLDGACAWGTFQGSGRDPYQTCVDFAGPAFKCTCPSRKFPCKHGLGLSLIAAQQSEAMTERQTPAWVAEWIAKRAEREEKKAANASGPESLPDPEAAAKAAAAAEKRAASREAKVTAGLTDLGLWLEDLVRCGFATLPGKPASFWANPAARLVDAQAPGLARRVRALDGIAGAGEHWPARLLREVSLLHLAREGWGRIASLPEGTQADLRAALGFTVDQAELLAQAGVRDRWTVIGQVVEEEERLRTQRSWLFGASTHRAALCLSFSAGPNQPLDITLIPGTTLEAELVFFPSAWPLRALVKERHGSPESSPPTLPHPAVAVARAFADEALIANPWVERVPLGFSAVTVTRGPRGWAARDAAGHTLALRATEEKAWMLLSLSGGHPVSMAGEWDGEELTPLGVWAEGRFVRV